jgi:hypothetical protein
MLWGVFVFYMQMTLKKCPFKGREGKNIQYVQMPVGLDEVSVVLGRSRHKLRAEKAGGLEQTRENKLIAK